MDIDLNILAPYILWAIAIGGVVYPWRFFKNKRRRFIELYACMTIGIAVGWLTDRSVEGLRGGMVAGALALPLLMRARREGNAPVRNERDSQFEGHEEEGTNERHESETEAGGDSG